MKSVQQTANEHHAEAYVATIRHKMMRSILEVSVLEGRDLRAADFGMTSDPYCVVCLSGDRKVGKRTRVIEKDLNPVWTDEDFVFDSIQGRPLRGSELLEIRVYDRDRGRFDDLIGSTAVPLEDMVEDWTESWYPLEWKGKRKGELKLRSRLVMVEDDHEDGAAIQDVESLNHHGEVFFQAVKGLKKTGRWKRKYLVNFKALPKSLYSFNSREEAKVFIDAFPDQLRSIKVQSLKIIDLDSAVKIDFFDDLSKRKSSVSSLGSIPSFSLDAKPNSQEPSSRSPSPSGRRTRGSITHRVFGCPYPGTVTKISTSQGSVYRFCTRTKAEASKWSDFLRQVTGDDEVGVPVSKILGEGEIEEEEAESYTRPDSNHDEIQEEEKLEDVFVENPNVVEHLLEGTVSIQGTLRRRRHYAVLTPQYLGLAREVATEEDDFDTILELSKVLSVTEEQNMQDAAFTIVFHEDAFKISQSMKLQKSLFEEGDFAGRAFDRRTFHVSSPRIVQTWVQKIDKAVKERQQNLHLWIALEEGTKVDTVQKFIKQGASAGSDNTKNGMLLFHYALVHLGHRAKSNEAGYLLLLKVLADAYPQALKTPIHDTRGLLPLHVALSRDFPNFKVVDFLLSRARHTAYKRTMDGDAAIHIACRWASPYGVKILLDACSAGSSFANDNRQLPLHSAVARRETGSKLSEDKHNQRRVEILKILLSDPQMASFVASIDKYQATPLHLACKYQGLSVVKMLVRANQKSLWCNDHYHNRPFHYACQRVEDTNASLVSMDIAVYVGSKFFCKLKNDNDKTPLELISSAEIRNRVLASIESSMKQIQRNASSHAQFDLKSKPQPVLPGSPKSTPRGLFADMFACCAGRRKSPNSKEEVNLFDNKKMASNRPEEDEAKPYNVRGKYIHKSGEIGPVLQRVNTHQIVKQYDQQIERNLRGVTEVGKVAVEINDMAEQGYNIEKEIAEKAEKVDSSVDQTVDSLKAANTNLMKANGGPMAREKPSTVTSLDPLGSAAALGSAVASIAKS